jgi:hypothetical protein
MTRNSQGSDPSSAETSRRRLLALGGAGSAAALSTLLSRREARAGHDGNPVLHLGVDNTNPPGTSTSLSGAGPTTLGGPAALELFGGLNVAGTSFMTNNGRALRILNSDPNAHDGALTVGSASTESGTVDVYGPGPGATLSGFSGSEGDPPGQASGTGTGVAGESGSGTGVHGKSSTGVGVKASSDDGHALSVEGAAAFATAGSAVIPAGQNRVSVANPAVTADSHISVTLTSDPGPRQLEWVSRRPGVGFKVQLTSSDRPERPETTLTYMIVEPG